MRIDEAADSDRKAVVGLWRACDLTRPWNDADHDYQRAVDGSTSAVLVARDADSVVGSVMVGFDGHRGWVYYLAVAPDHRRAGIGRRLMAAAEKWLKPRGAQKIQLMVREGNVAANAFYRALGLERQAVVTWGRFLNRRAQ